MDLRTHNKLEIAFDLFEEADRVLFAASRDVEYVSVILIAGAVANIVYPLLQEHGITPGRVSYAGFCNEYFDIPEDSSERHRAGDFLFAYNTLKHAGALRKGKRATEDDPWARKPSDDLSVALDLRVEAFSIMFDTASDIWRLHEIALVPKGGLNRISPLLEDFGRYQAE